jgi:hypothetical protein
MYKIIQIYPCLLKLSRKQESVTDGQTDRRPLLLYPSTLSRGDKNEWLPKEKHDTITARNKGKLNKCILKFHNSHKNY